jgi:hypothetical protein
LIQRTLELATTRAEPMIVLFGHLEYSPRSGFRPAREFAPPRWGRRHRYPLKPDMDRIGCLHLPEETTGEQTDL